jgi:hypothetical protein
MHVNAESNGATRRRIVRRPLALPKQEEAPSEGVRLWRVSFAREDWMARGWKSTTILEGEKEARELLRKRRATGESPIAWVRLEVASRSHWMEVH